MSDPVAPDYAAPIEAWRIWLVVARGGWLRLGSIVYDTVWPPGDPLVAECRQRRRAPTRPWRRERLTHAVPDQRCQCGIYAIADPLELAPYIDSSYPAGPGIQRVVGRVLLWGTVVESERGWRASRAYPARLYVPLSAETRDRAYAKTIATELADYRVPTEIVVHASTPDLLGAVAAGTRPEAA